MKFDFEGQAYRIKFRHDKPRDLAAHHFHKIAIISELNGLTVACTTCRVNCLPLTLLPLNKHQRGRHVDCEIAVYKTCPDCVAKVLADAFCRTCHGTAYYPSRVAFGVARVNIKAGDRYTREGGRVASLANAIEGNLSLELQAAVWSAYHGRKGAHGQTSR